MHKMRKRLALKRETLRHLWGGDLTEPPIVATPREKTEADSNSGGYFSCFQALCAPSAVPSACALYCCTKVC